MGGTGLCQWILNLAMLPFLKEKQKYIGTNITTAEKVKNTRAYYQCTKCDVNKHTSAIHGCNHQYADLLSTCKLRIGKQYGM